MKNNSGVTLISLAITIIVLTTLASIAIYSGKETVESSMLTQFTTEMKIMQLKVNDLYDSYTNNKIVKIGTTEYKGKGQLKTDTQPELMGIQEIGKDLSMVLSQKINDASAGSGIDIRNENGYKYYDREIIKLLDIGGVEGEYFVNIAKRKIINVNGFEYEGKKYYTLEQLPEGLYNVEHGKEEANLSFDITSEINNGNGKIHIKNISYNTYVGKWQIKYRIKANEGEEEKNWNTTEEFAGTETSIDIPIENILKEHEIQVIHKDEITSEIKTAYVLQIGDYINYDATNKGTINTKYQSLPGTYHSDKAALVADTNLNMTKGNGYASQEFNVSAGTDGWRVLGIDKEKKEILLVSSNNLKTINGTDFYLRGQTGYEWGTKELNDICAIYGQGVGASNARSINIDDINNISGYIPERTGDEKTYGDGEIFEYGNEVTFVKNANNISFKDTLNNKSGTAGDSNTIFRYYDISNKGWKTLTTEAGKNQIKLTSTFYSYYPDTLTTNSNGTPLKGISKDSNKYKLLFNNKYWVASSYTLINNSGLADYGIYSVDTDKVNNGLLLNSSGNISEKGLGIRPVVSLKSNVNILIDVGTKETPHKIQ